MKRIMLAAIAATALLVGAPAAQAEDKQLLLYNWTDYTAPDMIAKFEKETGIKVTIDTYDSNETLLAKLRAGGSGYDIAVASSDFVPIMRDQDLLLKIDAAAMPEYKNVLPQWRDTPWDKGHVYSVPYDWGYTAAVVDTAVYKGPTDTLAVLFDPPPELQGKISMLGSPSEVANLALVYMGKQPCDSDPADMKALSALLEKQKPYVKIYNSDGMIERIVAGEIAGGEAWSGDSMRARLQKSTLKYVFPKEGAIVWMDNIIIPKGAQHPEAAKQFVAFMMRPENAALQSNFSGYQNVIADSDPFLKKEYAEAPEFHAPESLKGFFAPACPEAATKAFDRIWTKLRQ